MGTDVIMTLHHVLPYTTWYHSCGIKTVIIRVKMAGSFIYVVRLTSYATLNETPLTRNTESPLLIQHS